jgi:hypothetical protein
MLCSHILAAFRGADAFRSADHLAAIKAVKSEHKLHNQAECEKDVISLTLKLSCDDQRTVLQGQETGQWLSAMPSTVNGMELSAHEFRDALLLRHDRCPPDLPPQHDGCSQKFSVRHALECKTGRLVVSRHNEIQDELNDLATKAFPPAGCDEPLINHCRNPEPKKMKLPRTLQCNVCFATIAMKTVATF